MSSPNKKDLTALFGKGAGAQSGAQRLGLDEESSAIIIANMDATTMPMCVGSPFTSDEEETDDLRLVYFVIDASSSMDVVEDLLRECFNTITIPGLLGGARPLVGAIRYGGIKFNQHVSQLWGGGWLPLTDKNPELTAANYRASGSTALNKAVLDGVTACTAYALQVESITGTPPQVTLAVFSDGANNCAPHDDATVLAVTSKLSPELFTLLFYGYETAEKVNFKAIAKGLGFNRIEEAKRQPGESDDDMKRRFRHAFEVFSSQIVQAASMSKVGTAAAPAGGSASAPKTAGSGSKKLFE